MRSFNLTVLLVALALTNLAPGHRKKAVAGCQCTEKDLKTAIWVVGKGVTLNPTETGPVSFTSMKRSEAREVLSNWKLIRTPYVIKSVTSTPPEIASTITLNVIAKASADLPKNLEFLVEDAGLQGDICVEATPVEVYRWGNGCANVRIHTPELLVNSLGYSKSAAIVEVYDAPDTGWTFSFQVKPANKAQYVVVHDAPPSSTNHGVRVPFTVTLVKTPTVDKPPCIFSFGVTVFATNGDLTLEAVHGFEIPVTCSD